MTQPTPGEWIEDERFARSRPEYSLESIAHLGGVSWIDAPKPPRWHRCKPQTQAYIRGLQVARCACGGIRDGGSSYWAERNTRSA